MVDNKAEYFDVSLLINFSKVINSTNIFCDIPNNNNLWNLICVLMDRLKDAVNYLNQHIEFPKKEEDFILFLVYASILRDGIYIFHENIYHTKPDTIDNKKWFSNAQSYSNLLFTDETCPTDDDFFEYLRALSFAHPFEVSKRKGRAFMEAKEIHYSPWVILHSVYNKGEDFVGIRVYSSKNVDGIKDIFISFSDLKQYLLERYNLISLFIKWGNEKILRQNNIWMEKKIERTNNPIITLQNICSLLEERFISHISIDDAIKFLKASFDFEPNRKAVGIVKEKINKVINQLCDFVDKLDYEGMEKCLSFLYERPKQLHQNAHYELSKIFSYLEDEKGDCLPESNEEWGLIQAKQFYDEYAKEFVTIDFNQMTYLEIKLLIRTSLILGRERELFFEKFDKA